MNLFISNTRIIPMGIDEVFILSLLTVLTLHLSSLFSRGPGDDTRVTEAGPEEGGHHEDEECATYSRNGRGHVLRQIPTAAQHQRARGKVEMDKNTQ